MKTLMMTAALLMASPALAGGLTPETFIRPQHRPEPCKIPILGEAGNVLYFNLSRSEDCRSTDTGDDDGKPKISKAADTPERPAPGGEVPDGGGDDGDGAGGGDGQGEGEPGGDGGTGGHDGEEGDGGLPDSCGLARSRSGHRSWDAADDGRYDGGRAGRSLERDKRDN